MTQSCIINNSTIVNQLQNCQNKKLRIDKNHELLWAKLSTEVRCHSVVLSKEMSEAKYLGRMCTVNGIEY